MFIPNKFLKFKIPIISQQSDINYFYVENIDSSNASVSLIYTIQQSGDAYNLNFEYSFDKKNWTSGTFGSQLTVPSGSKIYFRGDNENYSASFMGIYNYVHVSCNKLYNVGGDIISLIDSTLTITSVKSYMFYAFF